ncbi:CGNR zinc finger domain-containing protein [Leifsonia xyli]|nr:CGNR zinc finger domain-containing protein [Leifsonia xyli]
MHESTAQRADDVELALELANGLSQWRRGRLASSFPAHDTGVGALVQRLPDSMRLRRELRAVFAAKTLAEACGILNGMLAGAGANPVLALGPTGRWELRLRSTRPDPLSRTAVNTATALAELVGDETGWDGLRRCSAERCDDYFLDRSRNASRRYCSRTCANWMNARSFRRRQLGDE